MLSLAVKSKLWEIQKLRSWYLVPYFMAHRWGNNGNSERLIFLGSRVTADGNCSHEIKKCLLLGRKTMTNLDSILRSRDITLLTKVHLVKAMIFFSSRYGCESWTENQSWIVFGRTGAEAETLILWPPDAKSQVIGKNPDARKDWRQEERQRMRWLDGTTSGRRVWTNSGR